jgi:ionotropic glutamate receptor
LRPFKLPRYSNIIMKMNSTRFSFSLFFFIIIVSERMFLGNAQNTTVPVDVGVVLDMDTWNGKMGWSCINMALSDFYASHPHYKTRLRLNTRDSKSDVVGAAAAGSFSLCVLFIISEQQLR